MEGLNVFVFAILLSCTLVSAVPYQRTGEAASILDEEIEKDSLSEQLIRTKKSVDSGEIEDAAEKKINNEIDKRSSQGTSALWAQTTLNDVEMDRRQKQEESDEAERQRRQDCNFRTYPIEGAIMSFVPTETETYSSDSSMRSAGGETENTLGDSKFSAKTFSLHHQSILPMVHQPITHGIDEALPIYKPVQQVVQKVIQPIQPVIQPVVHPVQQVIQPVYQQIEPIVKPPVYQPVYHTPVHLPAIHQSLPVHQQHPIIPHHQLIPQHPFIPEHTPLCPCPPHFLQASRSAESASPSQDRAQDQQQLLSRTQDPGLQHIALYRDASQDDSDFSQYII